MNTKEKILKAGVSIWPDVTVCAVARAAGISHPLVVYHFPVGLKDAVAEYAVEKGESRVIIQLLASGHKAAMHLSPAARRRHFEAIS